jgi:hypothetical protein
MTRDWLAVWAAMGVLTGAADALMGFRRCSGKLGSEVRRSYLESARKCGGVSRFLILTFALELAAWPLGLAVCLYHWARDGRTYRAELAESAARRDG